MSLYAIGDTHLSLGTDKPMEVFGGRWENYVEKLTEAFSKLSAEDTCVLCGDISWGMDMKSSMPDFQFLCEFPFKKIILKGNHDYWWDTVTKMTGALDAGGLAGIRFLHNNCFFYEDIAICGTRGWFYEEEKGSEHDKKMLNRELIRLETSLKAAGEKDKYVFLHYPPKYGNYECGEILELLRIYEAKLCCSGHIHSHGLRLAFEGIYQGVQHMMVSADHVFFEPVKIYP